jgi:hypothetical protein
MSIYANAGFFVGSFIREIWIEFGRVRFYWVDEYHAGTMTPIYRTRHLDLGKWSWSGM